MFLSPENRRKGRTLLWSRLGGKGARYLLHTFSEDNGVYMSSKSLHDNLLALEEGVRICIENKLLAPALVLVYSGIDMIGWMDSNDECATKRSFLEWVEKYLLKQKDIVCTAMDLYAARCGLLHTFTPFSQLHTDGKARVICYAWGPASVSDLQSGLKGVDGDTAIAVHVSDLFAAWQLGVSEFLADIEKDNERRERTYKKAAMCFSEINMTDLE